MKYFVQYNDGKCITTEIETEAGVRKFISDGLNGGTDRYINYYTVFFGRKVRLETRDVVTKEVVVVGDAD